jgi:hypothetical protein
MTAYRAFLGSWAIVVATACVSVTTLEGERLAARSVEFRAYVESVFREQNRVATELAFALESVAPDARAYGELETAERELMAACTRLNQIATERRAGRDLGPLRQADAARSAPECERVTRASAARLESVRQETADGD